MQSRKSFPFLSTRVTEECFCGSKVMKERKDDKIKTFTVEDSRLVTIFYGWKTKKLFCLSISGEIFKTKKIIAKMHETAFSPKNNPLNHV